MSTGRSEAHPPQKVKHDRRSNGRIILFMSASFALGIESHCAVRRKACRNRRTQWITRRHPALKCDSGAILSLPCGEQKRRIRPSEGLGNYRRQSEQSRMELGLCLSRGLGLYWPIRVPLRKSSKSCLNSSKRLEAVQVTTCKFRSDPL